MLENKVALITGAGRGIGRAIAVALAKEGAQVIINYNGSEKKALEVKQLIEEQGGKAVTCQCDVSDFTACEKMIRDVVAEFGHLDILVNAAGVQRRHPSEEFPVEDYNYVIEVNQNAVFDWCQRAAKKFIAQDSKGKIINIASMLSFFGGYTVPAYAASKGAVAQLTKAFCNEWASKKINVNALAPGYMDTEMNTALTDPLNPRCAEITGRIPAHVWGTPEDMKGPCVFLASDASDYLNGAIIPVDGGYLVK